MSLPVVRFDVCVKSNNDANDAQVRVLVLSHNRVIVVGAGPVGLVTALLLAEERKPVTVLESDSTLSDDLRASTFHPPTLDMLDSLNLTERLLDQGLICPEWQIRMHATGEKAVFRLALIADLTNPILIGCNASRQNSAPFWSRNSLNMKAQLCILEPRSSGFGSTRTM